MFKRLMLFTGLVIGLFNVAGCAQQEIDLSPDGSHVAVRHGGSLWLADVEKETWHEVKVGGEAYGAPSWSPTGRHVVFQVLDTKHGKAESAEDKDTVTFEPRTVVYDVVSQQTNEIGENLYGPFAWSEDGSRVLGRGKQEQGTEFRWCETNGTVIETIPFAEDLGGIERLTVLPGDKGFVFISRRAMKDDSWTDVYRVQAGKVTPLSGTHDVVGLGMNREQGRLVWMSASNKNGRVEQALTAYDIASGQTSHLPLPQRLSAIRPERGYSPVLQSVTFSPNSARMALVVLYVHEDRKGDSHVYEACYSLETDGSGSALIRRTAEDSLGRLTPAWSRDGRRLALLDSADDKRQLFIYNADGSGKRLAAMPPEATPAARMK